MHLKRMSGEMVRDTLMCLVPSKLSCIVSRLSRLRSFFLPLFGTTSFPNKNRLTPLSALLQSPTWSKTTLKVTWHCNSKFCASPAILRRSETGLSAPFWVGRQTRQSANNKQSTQTQGTKETRASRQQTETPKKFYSPTVCFCAEKITISMMQTPHTAPRCVSVF